MEEKLNFYKKILDDKSFYGNNNFVIDNIETIFSLVRYIGTKYRFICDDKYIKKHDYKEILLDESISLAQNFFNEHSISINVEDLIKNNILVFNNSEKRVDPFYNFKASGVSYYEENLKKINVDLEYNLFDSMIIIHEIMHYLNQPDNDRNINNHLLTEALSFGVEAIYIDSKIDTEYKNDAIDSLNNLARSNYMQMNIGYDLYKIIYLYKEKKDITKSAYDEMFSDDNYERMIDNFDKYILTKKTIFNYTWNVLGYPLAVYLYEEYKENNHFIKNILEFNKSLFDNDFNFSLKVIGLDNLSMTKEKIEKSTELFIERIKELNKNIITGEKRWKY
ncbi:MAG: hypothetical protein PHQ64_03840 [Bacilli bacterium]|nr:hypothetical protein [Bacilli bacterium]